MRITPLVGKLPSGLRDNQNVNALTSTPEFQFVQAMLAQATSVPTQIAQVALILMSGVAFGLIRDRRSGSRLYMGMISSSCCRHSSRFEVTSRVAFASVPAGAIALGTFDGSF